MTDSPAGRSPRAKPPNERSGEHVSGGPAGVGAESATLWLSPEEGVTIGIVFWRHEDDDGQRAQVDALARWARKAAVASDGKTGFAVLRSNDGERVALYGHWRDGAARDAGLASVAQIGVKAPSDSEAFELVIQHPVGIKQGISRGDLFALGEFWVDPANQVTLMTREPAAALAALALDTGILSANFHRGLVGTRMVNLAQISSPDAISRLSSADGFDRETGYWRDIATNEFHVYAATHVVGGQDSAEDGR